jgi:ribosomal protein L33
MIEEKVKVKLTCSACDGKDHQWHRVYYEEFSRLKRAEKSFITFCNKTNQYVITNILE